MTATKKATDEAPAVAEVTYQDSVFSSRVVILPDGRVLAVSKQHVTVRADDKVALECLNEHADFKRQE